MRTAKSIMKELRYKAGVAKRKAFREEIKAADDNILKNDISHMFYILGLRRQMSKLTAAELETIEVLNEANTKKKRFCAIKRFHHVVYK